MLFDFEADERVMFFTVTEPIDDFLGTLSCMNSMLLDFVADKYFEVLTAAEPLNNSFLGGEFIDVTWPVFVIAEFNSFMAEEHVDNVWGFDTFIAEEPEGSGGPSM